MANFYYRTLEINTNATNVDIKKAYRRLALKHHPARNSEPGSSEKFTQIGEAYDVLSDLRRKATYDRFGEEGLKHGLPLEHSHTGAWSEQYVYHGTPEKTFKEFFGSDNPFANFFTSDLPLQIVKVLPDSWKRQDPPLENDLPLSLEDLFYGCAKEIKIPRRVMDEDGLSSSIKYKTLTMDVHPGTKEGKTFVFPKQGDQTPHSIPADVMFIVKQEDHPLFTRQEDDLLYKVTIPLEKALTGFCVSVQTLDNRLLNIPINDIVHPAYTKILRGEGMPLSQDSSPRGNLIISFNIQFPRKLSPDSRNLIKKALSYKN